VGAGRLAHRDPPDRRGPDGDHQAPQDEARQGRRRVSVDRPAGDRAHREGLAGDDLHAGFGWRGGGAEGLALRGEHDEAVRLAQAAVEIATATDALLDHADARLALAAALRVAGRRVEADAEERRARELWEAKGATLLAERAARGSDVGAAAVPAAAAPPPRRRRVRPNAATENAARLDAAIAARDGGALFDLFADDIHILEHAAGASFDRPGAIASWRGLIGARDPASHHEPLATLGPSLALLRLRLSASGSLSRSMDVGAYEKDEIHSVETDAQGRRRGGEAWSLNHLGDAVARLYERYAELLPEGPERERAEAVARSISAMASQPDTARRAAVFAPDIEVVDHRTLGTWSARGAESALRHFESIFQVSDAPTLRDHDVLALEPNAVLTLRAHTGVGKESGGAYERRFLNLLVAGADGRLARIEWFDADREAEALARFDAFAAGAAPPLVRQRVRPNAASALAARFEAAFSERDEALLAALWSDALEVVDHPTGACYGREGHLDSLARLARADTPALRIAPLATLGEDLLLARRSVGASGTLGGRFDVGAWERAEPVLFERDAAGRFARVEIFASERLGDAVVRLYARHAERLPEGPERVRAARAAQSQAALVSGSEDLTRLEAAHAPDFELVDHRRLALWSGRAGSHVDQLRSWQQVADDVRYVTREILALAPDALLSHVVNTGTDRVGGGDYERPFLSLSVTDDAGRLVRLELFDTGREAEALAHFDALSAGSAPAPRGFENAASRTDARLVHCFNARDWPGVLACIAPQLVFDERRRMTRNVAERDVWLEQFRLMFDQPRSRFTIRLVATRGERLSLHRHEFEAEVAGGGGRLEIEPHCTLHEVDSAGRIVAIVLFDLADEAAAHAELDARAEAGEWAACPRALVLSGALRRALVTRDWDAFAALMSPDFLQRDHRRLVWASEGRDAAGFLAMVRSLTDLAPDTTFHSDHARVCERGGLMQVRQQGSRDGGAFESEIVAVVELDAEGRVSRWDTYDGDPPDAALARYEEIRSRARAAAPFENAATRASDRLVALWSARDWAGLARLLPPPFRFHDRRRIALLEIDRDAYVESMHTLGEMASTHIESELLATRGERLALMRRRMELAGGDVGPSELQNLTLTETDERGEPVGLLRFDDDNLDAAYAELDARFAAGEGAVHPLALAWHRAFFGALARADWEALAATIAPSFVADDHRLAGWGTLESPARFVDALRAMVEPASDARLRVDHLRASGRSLAGHNTWVGTREGGAFEIPFATFLELDAEGRAQRLDQYDSLHAPRVLARFAEIAAGETVESTSASPFKNAATRAVERGAARVAARDWEGFRALLPPSLRYSDRTGIGKLETGRDEWLAAFRQQVEMTAGPLVPRVLATRGERLALVRMLWHGASGDVGESELDWLLLIEVDGRGDHSAVVSFEPGDLTSAYHELDARYADCAIFAAVQRWFAAVYRRDRGAFLAEFAPSFRVDDRRRLGFGALLDSAEALFRSQEALQQLAPDFRYRVDHFETRGRAFLSQVAQVGTREGGPFETPFLNTGAVDEQGRLTHFELYDVEEIEAAQARFEARAVEAPAASPFANAATRAADRVIEAWTAQDWERLYGRDLPEGFRLSDRRRAVQLEIDRNAALEFSRSLVEGGRSGRIRTETLATRGERLALLRWRVEVVGGDVGESEIRHLNLFEIDERGALCSMVRWDDDALEAAYAELDVRFEAIDRSAGVVWLRAFLSALERRDWDAVTALYAPDFVGSDHRLVGWGTLRGPVAFLESLRQMFALAPDASMRADHVRSHERGVIAAMRWVGTREGGAFESPFVAVVELGPGGTDLRADFYDPQHLPRALARFEEICTSERRDLLAALRKPNAASGWLNRFQSAFNTRDWDALSALYAPDVVYEDRQRLSLLSGGIDMLLSSLRERAEAGARLERHQLLGTAGDRVAIQRPLFAGEGAGGRFEMEFIVVQEVDEAGRLVATVNFDLGDACAAQREAWARWRAIEPTAVELTNVLREIVDASNARDRGRYRAQLSDDLVVVDHRRTGMGRIEGADAYLDSIDALWELAPGGRAELGWLWPARDRYRAITVVRVAGTLADGGEFENLYLYLGSIAGGRIERIELFELDDLDAALARFEALRPDPPRIPPNASTRANDRWWALAEAGDWDAIRALSEGMAFEDRRRLIRIAGGGELLLADTRHLWDSGWRPVRTLLATAGNRLSLERMLWTLDAGGQASEIEVLKVAEVDAEGRIVAYLIFDPSDRAAASKELFERGVRQGFDGLPRVTLEFFRAWNQHDRAGLEALLPGDYLFHDHRRTGIGRIEGVQAYVESLAALWELSPDVRLEMLYEVARAPNAFLGVLRWSGTNAEAGEFEAVFIGVTGIQGERQVGTDLFEIDEMDAALARFDELSAQAAPSSSTRAR
jgi:ketosteroid isomerase-like protein